VFVVSGYEAASLGNWFSTFRWHGDAASYPTRTDVSRTPQQKPDNSQENVRITYFKINKCITRKAERVSQKWQTVIWVHLSHTEHIRGTWYRFQVHIFPSVVCSMQMIKQAKTKRSMQWLFFGINTLINWFVVIRRRHSNC